MRLERSRRRLVTALGVAVLVGVVLSVVGWSMVRDSTPGTYVDSSLEPREPGYAALVEPTPTMLVLQRDAEGGLAAASLLALRSGGEGGSVIVMPVATRSFDGGETVTFADSYAEGGLEAVVTHVETLLNIAIHESVEVDDAGWDALVAPVSPVSLVLEDTVGLWSEGRIDLGADQVGQFLAARNTDESELNRLARQELFWREWLPRVGLGGDEAVPGESAVGLGRFIRGLAAGDVTVSSLPVEPADDTFDEQFEPSKAMMEALVATEIPYPQEPTPGGRIRVRLLNGTGEQDLNVRAASPLVAADAEIAVSGNASSFEEPQTRLIYATPRQEEAAEQLRDALGIGVVEEEQPDAGIPPTEDGDRIDVTVILGADAPEAIRRLETPG